MKEERRPPLTFQFKEGHYAFARGWLRNQYDEDSVKGKEWQRGWNKAYFDNLEEVKRKGLV
jgi:hypothetical protein